MMTKKEIAEKWIALAVTKYPILERVSFIIEPAGEWASKNYTGFLWSTDILIKKVTIYLASNDVTEEKIRDEVISIVSIITGKRPEIVKEELLSSCAN